MITHIIIPARTGSKGIKNKNIVKIKGKQLINFTIDLAKKCNFVDKIVVSTDGKKIARLALREGVEAPFIRPKKYSTGSSTDLDVFKHYIKWTKENKNFLPDILIHLRPTTPFRSIDVIIKAYKKFLEVKDRGYTSLRSMRRSIFSPFKMWIIEKNKAKPFILNNSRHSLPRQKLIKTYDHIGYVDILDVKKTILKNTITGSKVYPFVLKENQLFNFVDLDTISDLKKAKKILNEK